MKDKRIRIVYFGTADFALAPLQALLDRPETYEIAAVVSQPDRPAGRAGQMKATPVSEMARENNLDLFQPEKLDDNALWVLRELEAEIFVVAAYGLILPKTLLETPPGGALNLHGSLLPKHRGASPIQTAILEGDSQTGVTLIKMDEKMDHGPILDQIHVPINPNDDYPALNGKLSEAAAELLVRALPKYRFGELHPQRQEHEKATYTKIIKKEDGRIDWSKSANLIERKIRAYRPWPGTFCEWSGKRIKIITAETLEGGTPPEGTETGQVQRSKQSEMLVATADQWLKISSLQPQGKKIMTGREFLNGHAEAIGNRFD